MMNRREFLKRITGGVAALSVPSIIACPKLPEQNDIFDKWPKDMTMGMWGYKVDYDAKSNSVIAKPVSYDEIYK